MTGIVLGLLLGLLLVAITQASIKQDNREMSYTLWQRTQAGEINPDEHILLPDGYHDFVAEFEQEGR
jgi:hypothetical protein